MTQTIDATAELYGLKQTVVEQISHVLARYPEIERAVIYGSRAKGNFKPRSDIDLALIGKRMTESRLLELETQPDDLLLPYKLDLCLFHTLENQALIEHINRVGKAFFTQ